MYSNTSNMPLFVLDGGLGQVSSSPFTLKKELVSSDNIDKKITNNMIGFSSKHKDSPINLQV